MITYSVASLCQNKRNFVSRKRNIEKGITINQLVQGKPTTDNSYPENSSDRHRDPELAY